MLNSNPSGLFRPLLLNSAGHKLSILRHFIMDVRAGAGAGATISSSSPTVSPALVAVCQMTSTDDVQANLSMCQRLIVKSKQMGAVMTFLPGMEISTLTVLLAPGYDHCNILDLAVLHIKWRTLKASG